MDSSICVATMTGMSFLWAARDDAHLGDRHVLEVHLDAEVAARDHEAVGDLRDVVDFGDALRAFRSWR